MAWTETALDTVYVRVVLDCFQTPPPPLNGPVPPPTVESEPVKVGRVNVMMSPTRSPAQLVSSLIVNVTGVIWALGAILVSLAIMLCIGCRSSREPIGRRNTK
jgi:hypothetical protein